MVATDRLRGQLRRATYRTLIGLLAVTGKSKDGIRVTDDNNHDDGMTDEKVAA